MQNNNISTDYIQVDPYHETGKVEVSLDSSGSAKYNIISDVAWDFIEPKEEIFELVKNSSSLVFGSLAARAEFIQNIRSSIRFGKVLCF